MFIVALNFSPANAATSPAVGIYGKINLLAPDGGESLYAGETFVIAWNDSGTIPYVMLEYRVNFSIWNTITASTTNTNSFPWTIPNDPDANVEVRVSDVSYPSNTTDASAAVFAISVYAGPNWYVNDTSTAGDSFTAAVGDWPRHFQRKIVLSIPTPAPAPTRRGT